MTYFAEKNNKQMGGFTWQQILLYEGKKHNMCSMGTDMLKPDCSKEEAVRVYKKVIDWGLEEDFPRIDFLRREFSGFEHLGICIDKNFGGDLLNDQAVYVFHHCSGIIYVDLNIDKGIIPMYYFANDCNVTVRRRESAAGDIRIPIYIYGENKVRLEPSDSIEYLVSNFDLKTR